MVVCQFYLRGQCRFGSACRNEHPKDAGKSQTAFTSESIKKDLTPEDGKPSWPLSSYGPAKGEITLIHGLDESPEELRLMAWQALKSGDSAQLEGYKIHEANKIAAALAAHRNAEMNSMDAFKVAFEASSRITSSAFGEGRQQLASTSTFRQPSSSPFGQFSTTPTFGQPKSAFDQPSKIGQLSNTQPASSSTPSAFAQPSSTTSSAFGPGGVGSGKSNLPFGQSSFGQNSFFSKPANSSVFGQVGFSQPGRPSAFGTAGMAALTQATPPVFGQISTPRSSSLTPSTGFAAFSQPQQNQNQSQLQTGGGTGFSAFAGKPATFGQPINTFGASSTSLKPVFGTHTNPAANANQPFPPLAVNAFSSTPPTSKMEEVSGTAMLPRLNSFSSAIDPYATNLPENYREIIPKKALEAFESSEFTWGYVPEWIPPISMR